MTQPPTTASPRQVFAGPVWGIAIPTASVLLAIWFRRAGQSQRRAAAP